MKTRSARDPVEPTPSFTASKTRKGCALGVALLASASRALILRFGVEFGNFPLPLTNDGTIDMGRHAGGMTEVIPVQNSIRSMCLSLHSLAALPDLFFVCFTC